MIYAVLIATILFYRLLWGIDFSDESYYIAMALRFARGDQPFVDELFIHQIPSVLLTPLAWIWLKIHGGTEGVVLGFRCAYLVVAGSVSLLFYRITNQKLSSQLSFVGAALIFVCIPLQIPSLSYNSLGSLALSLSCGWSFAGSHSFRSRFLFGLLLATMVSVYPPLLIPATYLLVLNCRTGPLKPLIWGGAIGLFCFSLILLQAGEKLGLALGYSWVVFGHGGGWEKIILVLNHFFIANTAVPWRVIFTLVVLSRFLPSLQKFQFPIVPILVFMAYRETLFISLWWVFYLGALAPFLFLALPASQRPGRELFFHFWIPSVLGAFLVGWTSASSPINGSLTMVPAAFVSVICLIAPIPLGQMKWRRMVLIQVTLLALFCQFGGKAFYRDGNWNELTEKVEAGPFKGVQTTPHKLAFLKRITQDIEKEQITGGRIFFYEFPAGYLISSLLPSTYSSWVRQASRKKDVYVMGLEHYFSPENRVFLLKWITHEWPKTQYIGYSEDDPVSRYLLSTHSIIRNTEEYVILKPNR